MSKRSRFLTPQEKIELQQDWENVKADFARRLMAGEIDGNPAGRGFPDPEVYELVNALNNIDGICCTESCSGHRVHYEDPGYEGPTLWSGQIWLRITRAIRDAFIEHVEELAVDPHIERTNLLFGPGPDGDIIDIIFQGLNVGETIEEGKKILAETQEVLVNFFRGLSLND